MMRVEELVAPTALLRAAVTTYTNGRELVLSINEKGTAA
jgi:hypothetical protein